MPPIPRLQRRFLPLRLFVGLLGMCCLILLAQPHAASAQASTTTAPQSRGALIEDIRAEQAQNSEVLRIRTNQVISQQPSTFVIESPARLVLDFERLGFNPDLRNLRFGLANLQSARLIQTEQRTRLVLQLKTSAAYTIEAQDKTWVLTLVPGFVDPTPKAIEPSAAPSAPTTSSPVAPALPTPAATPSPAVRPASNEIRAIDFRRPSEGIGSLRIDLPTVSTSVQVRREQQRLVLEIDNASLPERLRQRLDVSDFATPMQTVTPTAWLGPTKLVLQNTGNWEYRAYQSDRTYVLEVRKTAALSNAIYGESGYSGEKISLNFQNIDVRALLQVIADFTNFNVVTSDSVNGALTLRLKDVPWDQALDIVLQAKGLAMRKNGSILWIAPREEVVTREKLELEGRNSLENLEPLQTLGIQLNYAKAIDVASQLSTGRALTGGAAGGQAGFGGAGSVLSSNAGGFGATGQSGSLASGRILSPRGSAVADARTNQLLVTDVAAKLEQVRQLVNRLDIPIRQVMIEARIVEADDRFGRSLGAKLGGSGSYTVTPGSSAAYGGNYLNTTRQTNYMTDTVDYTNTQFVNLPAAGLSGYNAPTFSVALFKDSALRFLNLELSALEAQGRGKVVSSPRVITADQVKASIEQGTELPYQVATLSGSNSVAFRKVLLKLEVTPQITPEGGIILDVDVSKDSVGQSTPAGFAIDTKHVKTQVLVDNGGTVVIGGIFQVTEREEQAKVPFLGDIPYLGALFRNKQKISNKSELLVFLTPKTLVDARTATRSP